MSLKSKEKIILHIGFPRCASTSLQKNLLSRHPLILPILRSGKPKNENNKKWNLFFNEIVNKNGTNFIKSCKKEILNLKSPKKTIVVSSENIVTRVSPFLFKKFFPKSTILVFVREPISYYESLYAQYLKGFGGKFKKITGPDKWLKYFFLKKGNEYEKLYKILSHLKNWKIKIIPFELLLNDKQKFSQELALILNINSRDVQKYFFSSIQNTRVNKYLLLYKKIKNFFPSFIDKIPMKKSLFKFFKFLGKFLPNKPVEVNFRPESINFIKKKTHVYCKKIDNFCNYSLNKFNYYK